MLQRVPNAGLLFDDFLEDLRAKAIIRSHDFPLPKEVVNYVHELERLYLNLKVEERKRGLSEICFRVDE